MDTEGQVSLELVFLTGFIMVLAMGITSYVGEDVELNQAMAAARSGATEGANINSFAIYPEDTFRDYSRERPWLLNPGNVKIVSVEVRIHPTTPIHPRWNRTWYQLQITVSHPTLKNRPKSDKDPLGDRINHYARTRISGSFGMLNRTPNGTSNPLNNPSFSNRYVFTTQDVRWI